MKNFNSFLKELRYANDNVGFYKKSFSENNIELDKIQGIQDVDDIPFTDKADYRKNFPIGTLAKGFAINHPMVTSSRSSGSTGERLITIEMGMNLLNRAISCAKINPVILESFTKLDRKIARYAAPNCSDVECANPNSSIEDRTLADNTLVLPVYHDLLTTTEAMIDRTIEEIETFQPDLFYIDPTHFAFLLREYKKRGLMPPQIPIIGAYTGTTACSRRQITEFYHDTNMYSQLLSSTEFGWVAMECSHGHLHLNDDSFFFEYVDLEDGEALPDSFKELCISSIDQGASPHIRYRTADIVSVIEGQCECGSDRPQIIMEGKLSHFLSKDGLPFLSPNQVDKLIGAPQWLELYQIEQTTENSFLLKIIVNDNYEQGSEQYIANSLQEKFETGIRVDVRVVNYISAERSGKYQYVKGLSSHV